MTQQYEYIQTIHRKNDLPNVYRKSVLFVTILYIFLTDYSQNGQISVESVYVYTPVPCMPRHFSGQTVAYCQPNVY